ncbi:hypothetical protein GOBAR_AA10396 [Gossypium barbadense]|uniref:Leucine-rich repeat-containing N-terminal plant-type domain-containing protein n=1 Tax=Gossypium barbadense TaxID=3634 RepID=A0A2P5Y3Q8_GOSBA|nr:hypothetical protein GOBAR_AA10396 [Gossypium barbadense]
MTTPLPISFFPFLLLIPAICFTICHANSNLLCIQSEREALLKFKNDLIDPSNRLSSWVEGRDCCEWIGVFCQNSTGHVHQLHLASPLSAPDFDTPPAEWEAYYNSVLGGKGAIPHNLGNLSKLQYLDLGGNYLGDLERVTFKLPSLLELHLSGCGLHPSSISVNSSKSLVILDLSWNRFSPVPKWIFSLHGLVSIDLRFNYLEGPIPDYFGNFSFLEVLDLSGNSFDSSIPNSLYSLNRLQFLSVRGNQLQGTISSAIGNLSSITHLDLSYNYMLEGRLPTSLEYLCKLKEMDLSYNKIEGGISEILQSLSRCCLGSLESLDMSNNQLYGHLTDQLGQFKNLSYLSLAQNKISGPIPSSIGELSSLKFFDVSENQLNVCNSSSGELMEVLYIDKNLILGEIPDCWNHWQDLGLLDLGSNNLTGKIPPSLGHINLTVLNLRNNSMFGELPSTLQNSSLTMLDLSENHFNGSVPAWIGDNSSLLRIISLRSNNFDGHIPHKICDLLNLQNLDLAHNNISGTIPKCFRKLYSMANRNNRENYMYVSEGLYLSALLVLKGRQDEYGATLGLVTSIDLSTNSLTGEIPKEIGRLVELRSLNLSGNLLTGNIPDNIGNMKLMESLDLSMNRLNGEIPLSFSNLNFLNHFNVSYNNLTGQIPTSTQLQSFENYSYMGNHLCGPPLTKNCSTKDFSTEVENNGSSGEGSKVNGLYVSIVLGFVMGFWGVVAPLFFSLGLGGMHTIESWTISVLNWQPAHLCEWLCYMENT